MRGKALRRMEVRQDDKGWSDLDSDQYGGESTLDEKMGSDDDASQGMRYCTSKHKLSESVCLLVWLFILSMSISDSIPQPDAPLKSRK